MTATACPLAQPLLFLLKTVKEIDDDVADAWQKAIKTGLTGLLAQRLLKDGA